MTFKERVYRFSEQERALLYAFRMYCANSLIEGTTISLHGHDIDVVFGFKISGLLQRAGDVVKEINGIYVLKGYCQYANEINLNKSTAEIARSVCNLKPRPFKSLLSKILKTLESKKSVQDVYPEKQSKSLTPIKLVRSWSIVSDYEKSLIEKYLLKFSTKKQLEKGEYSRKKNTMVAMSELESIIEDESFYFNGQIYHVEREVIIDAIEYVSNMNHLSALSNNNYLKKVMMNHRTNEAIDIADSTEGF